MIVDTVKREGLWHRGHVFTSDILDTLKAL